MIFIEKKYKKNFLQNFLKNKKNFHKKKCLYKKVIFFNNLGIHGVIIYFDVCLMV